jgi:hypothetical protein
MPEPLVVREHPVFLDDKRDVEAALIGARRFARDSTADPSAPFATEQEAKDAADMVRDMKIILGAAEDHRKEIARPFLDMQRAIKADYDELLAQPKAAIQVLTKRALATKKLIERRRQEEEEQRREALRKREEEAAVKAAEAAARAEADPTDASVVAEAVQARENWAKVASIREARERGEVKPQPLRGEVATLSATVTYKWDVFDLEAVPREHLTFNKKSIDAAVKAERSLAKAQNREFNLQLIDGVRIWPVEGGMSR